MCLCNLTADEALQGLNLIIEPHSMAEGFFCPIKGKSRTLEAAFDILYKFDRNATNMETEVRELKNLKITQLKNPQTLGFLLLIVCMNAQFH